MKQTCKQCGEAKPSTLFRTYYNTGNGRYRICYDCEQINSRRKYLEKKQKRTDEEQAELLLIYQLYEALREKGLAPPRPGRKEVGVKHKTEALLSKLASAGSELTLWLTKDLAPYTPDELNDVYDNLKATYRPRVGMDTASMLPMFDETYRTILDKILVRFDDYEEGYYGVE